MSISALGDLARRHGRARREVAAARRARDAAIVAALEAGERPTDVAAAAGLTVARVHQVRRASR